MWIFTYSKKGEKRLIIKITDDFDLKKIADSGQCFRWERIDENPEQNTAKNADGLLERNTYRIIAGASCLYITSLGDDRYELECSEDEYESFWKEYFDFGLNYRKIRGRIDPHRDPFLYRASEYERGIRILRQDPWEMLVSFIISQNKNIPAIRRSVEMLAAGCGEKKTDSRGHTYYAFPLPADIQKLPEETLKGCKLGYRCKYVHAAAVSVLNKEIDLEQLCGADEESTIKALSGLFGVGVKVANCVSLFGLHHIDAFPIDVWIKRILEEQYPGGYPYEDYTPYNGIYQQYMFAYYRHQAAEK